MRVPIYGKDEENREILRGMLPAKITMNMLMSRFGIWKLKHPLVLDKTSALLNGLPSLHNYFMQKNPAYADLKRLLDEFKAKPGDEPPPMKTPSAKKAPKKSTKKAAPTKAETTKDQPQKVLVDIKDAMLRMKLDEKCVQLLKQKTGIADYLLHEFLSFVGEGKMKEEKLMGLGLGVTLVPLNIGLPEYRQNVSLALQETC